MRALNRLSGCPAWSVCSQILHGFVRMVFQISKCNRDNLEIISQFPLENICCDPSLELSETVLMRGHNLCFQKKTTYILTLHLNCHTEGSQPMCSSRTENYPKNSYCLELCSALSGYQYTFCQRANMQYTSSMNENSTFSLNSY